MLMTCANPECSAPFNDEGRFFRFYLHGDSNQVLPNTHTVQHFWLCKTCSGVYTLEWRKDNCVVLRPQSLTGRANASTRVIRADGL